MRRFEVRETYLYLDEQEMPKSEITRPWGTLKNPIRLSPTSVTIKWERSDRNNQQWELKDLTVYGNRLGSRDTGSYSVHYSDHWSDKVVGDPPEWVNELVRQSHPGA